MMNNTQPRDYRQQNALSLAVRHLAARGEKHIHARQVDGKLVWLVESQTQSGKYYTVTRAADGWPVDSCSCEDACYRHQVCKHQKAVALLTQPAQPAAPAPVSPTPAPIRWTSEERKGRRRSEPMDELDEILTY